MVGKQQRIHTNLYIGNGAYKIRNNSDSAWKKKKELPNQLLLARTKEEISGNAFFSAKSLRANHTDVVKHLKRKYYKEKVLTPIPPRAHAHSKTYTSLLSIKEGRTSYQLKYKAVGNIPIKYVQIYAARKIGLLDTSKNKQQIVKYHLGDKENFHIPKEILKNKKQLALVFIDAFGRESAPIILNLNQKDLYDTER